MPVRSETRRPLTGGCRCGRCRYSLVRCTEVVACHCQTCRRVSGGDGMVWVCATAPDLVWQHAPDRMQRSAIALRGYCGTCGTALSMAYHQTGEVAVWLKTLDRPTGLGIDRHIFTHG